METRDPQLKRLEEEQGTLNATKIGQQKELETLQSERQVLKDLAGSTTFHEGPQPESGPKQQPADPFVTAAAQEQLARKEAQVEKATAAVANTDSALAANQDAQNDRKKEIEQEKLEQKTNTVEIATDRLSEAADLISYHVDQLPTAVDAPNFDLAGTGKQIGEAAAYGVLLADQMRTAGVDTVVKYEVQQLGNKAAAAVEYADAKIAEVGNSVGVSPDHAELRTVEHEIDNHKAQLAELDTFAERFKRDLEQQKEEDKRDEIAVEDQEHAIRVHFEAAAEDAKKIFAEQDRDSADRQATSAQDPSVRTVQAGAREDMAEEMIAKRDEVTRKLCEPVAELNVDERNARTLEDSAGLNKAHLERYGMKVANEPDGPEKIAKFASDLEKGQQDLKQDLNNGRDQAIANEVTSLQGQHFPEVQAQAQALQGPSMAPQQTGPGGGGAGGGGP
jgi:hypothetical protein